MKCLTLLWNQEPQSWHEGWNELTSLLLTVLLLVNHQTLWKCTGYQVCKNCQESREYLQVPSADTKTQTGIIPLGKQRLEFIKALAVIKSWKGTTMYWIGSSHRRPFLLKSSIWWKRKAIIWTECNQTPYPCGHTLHYISTQRSNIGTNEKKIGTKAPSPSSAWSLHSATIYFRVDHHITEALPHACNLEVWPGLQPGA